MHLKRIAPYLTMGKGIWWATKDDNYYFHDADNDLNIHEGGPDLLHFRNSSLDKLWKRNEKLWEEILERRVILPTPSITIYNQQGILIERRLFTNDESTPGTSTASLRTQDSLLSLSLPNDSQMDTVGTQDTPLSLSQTANVGTQDIPLSQVDTIGTRSTPLSLSLPKDSQMDTVGTQDIPLSQMDTTGTQSTPLSLSLPKDSQTANVGTQDIPLSQMDTIGTQGTPLSLSQRTLRWTLSVHKISHSLRWTQLAHKVPHTLSLSRRTLRWTLSVHKISHSLRWTQLAHKVPHSLSLSQRTLRWTLSVHKISHSLSPYHKKPTSVHTVSHILHILVLLCQLQRTI